MYICLSFFYFALDDVAVGRTEGRLEILDVICSATTDRPFHMS